VTAAALAAAAVVAAASGNQVGGGPAEIRLPGATPASVVAGGDQPWVRGGPTGRAALRTGWHVALDPNATGAARGWRHGRFAGRAVSVPFVPNADQLTPLSFYGSVAWYRRELKVRHSGPYVLRFGSINHRATVWVDGKKVAAHVGTYLPFEVTLTLDARRVHRLVVRADWRDPDRMKAEGFHRTWFNFGGINREVTLRRAGTADLSAPTVRTRVRTGRALVDVGVEVRNLEPTTRTIDVEGVLAGAGHRYVFRIPGVSTHAGDAQVVHTTIAVPGPALWSPGHPALYDLQLVAGAGEAGYRQRVGLREVTWRDGRMFLNGRPLRLRGASLQEDARGRGDALRPADQRTLAGELVRLGANVTRAQHPLDPGLLERLDAAGILVWMGVGPVDSPGSWTSRTPHKRRVARARTMAAVREAQPHPSVLAYNLVNEIAGNGHDPGQVAYLRAMTGEVRAYDPDRLVALDVWGAHPPKVAGAVYRPVDAVGVTNYAGWYDSPYASTTQLRKLVRAKLTALQNTFRGKVLVVSEFGAEGNERNPSAQPGGLAFQARLLRTHLGVYARDHDVAGALVWALRDFAVSPRFAGGSIHRVVAGIRLVKGLNQKGLITYGGRPKPAAAAVRKAFSAFGER
jgi:beta-glucuronidase